MYSTTLDYLKNKSKQEKILYCVPISICQQYLIFYIVSTLFITSTYAWFY